MYSHRIARSHPPPTLVALTITRDGLAPGVRVAPGAPRARLTGNAVAPARPDCLPWISRRGCRRANPVAQIEALFAEAGRPRSPSMARFCAPIGGAENSPGMPSAPPAMPETRHFRHPPRGASRPSAETPRAVVPGTRMGKVALRAHATQIYEAARAHFRGHGKSSNKCRVPTHPDDTRASRDLARWLYALEQTASMQLSKVPMIQQINARVGNCDEMALYALMRARAAGLSAQLLGLRDAITDMGLHTVCIVAPLGPKQRRGRKWVIDPWAGIVTRAPNYGVRLRQQMEKWAAQGKHIYCFRRQVWMEATDPRWLDAVLRARAVPINV